jgi:TonB-dependent receptor-like protein
MGAGNPAETIGLNTGVTNPRDFGLPHLAVRDFAFLGSSPFSNPKGWVGTNWHVSERFTWVHSSHSLKMGYEFRRANIDSFDDVNFRGKLEFASLQDFLAGKVARGAILKGNSDRSTSQNSHALYVHDNFRLVSDLTLNFGVRWEYFGVLHEDSMLFSSYDPSRGLVVPSQLYERDLNNFSPRGGFAWDIQGRARTVLRAGAGVHFDAFPQDFFIGQIQFNTFNAGVAFNPIPQSPILTSRSPASAIKAGQPVFPELSFSRDSRDAWAVARISTPNTVNYNLNLQQELSGSAILEVGYVGSVGRRLFRTRDINGPLVPGASRPFDTAAVLSPIAPNRPFIVNQLETSASSNYNSLQVSFNQRRWHGLTNLVAWTWSHSIDNASDGIDSVPNMASPDNPHAPDRERANSNFDTRHRFTWASTYDLPKSIAPGRLGEGWQIAGLLMLSSGEPYNVNFGDEFDSQGVYDFILRPDVVGNPLHGTAAPDRLLNLAAFQVPCTLDGHGTDVSNCLPGTLHFGNLPRNAFVGPGFKNLDLSISKTTALTEQLKLQIKAGFFNATNHPNFSSPLVPTFIARASLKGIDANGRGGARGTGCNTSAASNDCYLPSTRSRGARSVQLSIRIMF